MIMKGNGDMKEFIDKLIARLKDNRRSIITTDEDLEWNRAVHSCIEIVNQLAEEYNNESVKGDLISRSLLLKAIDKCLEDCENHMSEPSIWNAIGIIKRQPTVCNDDWIPCSSPLVPPDYCIVRIQEDNGYLWIPKVGEYRASTGKWRIEGAFEHSNGWLEDTEHFKVVAWQPLPPKFEPKGE